MDGQTDNELLLCKQEEENDYLNNDRGDGESSLIKTATIRNNNDNLNVGLNDEIPLIGAINDYNDDLITQLAGAGTVGVAAAAAILSSKNNSRHNYHFETNPAVRKRQQTRLLRKLKELVDEYAARCGQQICVICCTPTKIINKQTIFKVFGTQPLETVVKNQKTTILLEMDNLLEQTVIDDQQQQQQQQTQTQMYQQQSTNNNNNNNNNLMPPTATTSSCSSNSSSSNCSSTMSHQFNAHSTIYTSNITNNSRFDLPSLTIDGIPTTLDKMTQCQLRMFIPLLLKYSTGRQKPGWNRIECKPVWWPDDLPWANIRVDPRDDNAKKKHAWTEVLKTVIRNCYKYHNREDLLDKFNHVDSSLSSNTNNNNQNNNSINLNTTAANIKQNTSSSSSNESKVKCKFSNRSSIVVNKNNQSTVNSNGIINNNNNNNNNETATNTYTVLQQVRNLDGMMTVVPFNALSIDMVDNYTPSIPIEATSLVTAPPSQTATATATATTKTLSSSPSSSSSHHHHHHHLHHNQNHQNSDTEATLSHIQLTTVPASSIIDQTTATPPISTTSNTINSINDLNDSQIIMNNNDSVDLLTANNTNSNYGNSINRSHNLMLNPHQLIDQHNIRHHHHHLTTSSTSPSQHGTSSLDNKTTAAALSTATSINSTNTSMQFNLNEYHNLWNTMHQQQNSTSSTTINENKLHIYNNHHFQLITSNNSLHDHKNHHHHHNHNEQNSNYEVIDDDTDHLNNKDNIIEIACINKKFNLKRHLYDTSKSYENINNNNTNVSFNSGNNDVDGGINSTTHVSSQDIVTNLTNNTINVTVNNNNNGNNSSNLTTTTTNDEIEKINFNNQLQFIKHKRYRLCNMSKTSVDNYNNNNISSSNNSSNGNNNENSNNIGNINVNNANNVNN